MTKETVKLETELNTFAEPVFIVKDKDGCLHLAVAVLEYDINNTKGDEEKKKGVKGLQKFFKGAKKLQACEFKSEGTLSGAGVTSAGAVAMSAGPGGGGGGGGQPGQPGQPGGPGGPPPPPPPPSPPPAPPPLPPGVQTEPPGVQTGP